MAQRTERFGDSPEAQDRLAALVGAGKKRATTSLARWYGEKGIRPPFPGETWTVLDGAGRERCRCRTIRTEIRRFADVDAEFAAAEGEGSLCQWRENHRAFFRREAEREGFAFDEETPVLLEWFECLETTPPNA